MLTKIILIENTGSQPESESNRFKNQARIGGVVTVCLLFVAEHAALNGSLALFSSETVAMEVVTMDRNNKGAALKMFCCQKSHIQLFDTTLCGKNPKKLHCLSLTEQAAHGGLPQPQRR